MTGPERTEDGRYIVVKGRRWRATDPSIPERLRAELVGELMAARRAVKTALAENDDDQEKSARRRVDQAKRSLGERGHPWWEPADADALHERAEATMRTLLQRRGPDKSICPSDVARVIGADQWRRQMDLVRTVAVTLASADIVTITRGSDQLDPSDLPPGPIRIRQGPSFH